MRKISVVIISLVLLSSLSYAAQDKREAPQQSSSQQKPILPPTVPSGSSVVSPTLSPHISVPSIGATTINTPTATVSPQISIPSMPSTPTPAQVPMPNMTAHAMVPQVPIIGNTIGEVVDKGKEKNGRLWLEVRDSLFEQVVRIKIKDLNNTPIVEQAERRGFEDIKIKDMVNVIFTNDNQDNIANFISIVTEEEAQLYIGTPISEQLIMTDETKE